MPTPIITLIAYITNSIWFKLSFGISFTTQTFLVIQESINTNEKLLSVFFNNTPTIVLYIFGLIWVSFKIVDAASGSWEKLQLRRENVSIKKLERKMKEEDLVQEKIETKEMSNKLDK